MSETRKKHALRLEYVCEKQLTLAGFETPFVKNLDANNC
jgi:hypothetical protein